MFACMRYLEAVYSNSKINPPVDPMKKPAPDSFSHSIILSLLRTEERFQNFDTYDDLMNDCRIFAH